jgi:hypothetical protein
LTIIQDFRFTGIEVKTAISSEVPYVGLVLGEEGEGEEEEEEKDWEIGGLEDLRIWGLKDLKLGGFEAGNDIAEFQGFHLTSL